MDTLITNEIIERREVIEQLISRLNTNCPGVVISFNASDQTVSVRPAIQLKVKIDGVDQLLTLPQIIKAPCVVPMASVAGFAVTLPISAGDPCLIHFSQRCIDNWWANGGVQPPETSLGTSRHHALTDAIVTFAPNPLTSVFTNWLTTGIELRNRARNSRVTVLNDQVEIHVNNTIINVKNDGTVTVTAPTTVTIDTPLTHITGNVNVDGGITCTGTYGSTGGNIVTAGNVIDSVRSMAADRVIYNGHTHSDPQGGSVATTGSAM